MYNINATTTNNILLVNGSEFASVLGRVVHEAGHGWQEVDGVRHPAELPPRVVPARRSQNGYMKGRSMLMFNKSLQICN